MRFSHISIALSLLPFQVSAANPDETGMSQHTTIYTNQQALDSVASTVCYTSKCGAACSSGYNEVGTTKGQPWFFPTDSECNGADLKVRVHDFPEQL